jgi:isoleucyl-tRNA synthetase
MPHLAEDVWQNLPFEHTLEDGSVAKFAFELKWPDKNEEWCSVQKDDVDFLSVILEVHSTSASLKGIHSYTNSCVFCHGI